MTIIWNISQMDRNAANGGVTVAHWNVGAVDRDHAASAYGSAGFTPDASAPDFKPYDQLTQADVLEWAWGSVDKAEVEASLAAQIEAKKNPVTLNGLPW